MKILRECAFEAKLIDDRESRNLRFTTERKLTHSSSSHLRFHVTYSLYLIFDLAEAAAIYCMKVLKELNIDVGCEYITNEFVIKNKLFKWSLIY